MIILSGASSLSAFRRQKLLSNLQRAVPSVTSVVAEFVHFAEVREALSETDLTTLEALMTYGPSEEKGSTEGTLLLVVPRSGTISPWSSKATDIAHNCGLHNVLRVERGTAYYVQAQTVLTDEQQALLAELLSDRMVETVLKDLQQAEMLFTHHQPKPMTQVDILGRRQRSAKDGQC